jgi:uncharacterized protein (TIGR03083 family)
MSSASVHEIAATRTASLRKEIASLKELVTNLPADALSLPSACTEWEVQDVAAHLVAAAENWANIVERALTGASPSNLGRSTGPAQPDENAETAIRQRKELGQRLVPTLLDNLSRLDQVLTKITPQNWETEVRHNADGQMPLWKYINSITRGVGVHGWDMRWGVDHDAPLGADCVPGLVDSIDTWLRVFCFHPTERLEKAIRFRFLLSGSVTGSRDVVVKGDNFDLQENAASPADVVYQCEAGVFVLMAYGRLTRHEAQSRGRLTIDGDEGLAARFDEWFNTG